MDFVVWESQRRSLSDAPGREQIFDVPMGDCLHQLYSQELEETARAVLDLFGKLDRPYLTPLEEKLLAVLEAQ